MYDHPNHQPSEAPVEGCADCDREIGRPIRRCFGDGSSSAVLPQPRKRGEE